MNAKVPITIILSLLFLVVGFLAGAAGMAWYDYTTKKSVIEKQSAEGDKGTGALGGLPPGQMPGQGMPPGKGPPAGGAKNKKGGGGGAKFQLVSLVDKLDMMIGQPPRLNLTKEQKQQLAEQLKGLGEMEDLSDDEAKTRLDQIFKILSDHKDVLKEAGIVLPGEARAPAAGNPPNPFVRENNRTRLEDLQKHLQGTAG